VDSGIRFRKKQKEMQSSHSKRLFKKSPFTANGKNKIHSSTECEIEYNVLLQKIVLLFPSGGKKMEEIFIKLTPSELSLLEMIIIDKDKEEALKFA
jgi:hypothetical protein